jgi:putative transposase
MSNYRRNYISGGTYFFTVNLLERKKTLLVDYIEELRTAVRKTKTKRPFHIDAWVVLPDHMHCIWTLPENEADYSARWCEIKKVFSKSIPKGEYRSKTRIRRHERGIWQYRFWEHTIRNEIDYQRHMDYCHFNPHPSYIKKVVYTLLRRQ